MPFCVFEQINKQDKNNECHPNLTLTNHTVILYRFVFVHVLRPFYTKHDVEKHNKSWKEWLILLVTSWSAPFNSLIKQHE